MSNSITIQLRPTRKYDKPSVANLFHNAGLSKANYWIKNPDNLISNLDLKNLTTRQAVDLWREWEQQATDLVLKNKGKRPQKRQVLIEEGLMVIGKDILEKDPKTFIEIFEKFKKYFEKKYNTKILAYFFHNHEGHIDLEEGEFSTNLHIHFFFLNVDKEGNSVRRQIKKTDLSYFQTKIHEIGIKYIQDLERATDYKKLGLKAPKHLSHREYRTQKIKDTQLRLAPEIKSIKKENKELKEENKELLAKIKDLKAENKRIREQFKELGAVREDYARLEALNKELKQKIKLKELTLQEMQEKFNKQLEELETKLKEEQEKNKQLDNENGELDRENYALINELYEEKRKNEELESMIRGFFEPELNRTREENEQLKEELKEKDEEIKALKEENQEQKKEIESLLLRLEELENKRIELQEKVNKKIKHNGFKIKR